MANITIDGQSIDTRPDDTILEAAKRAGIDIPTLCYLEGFEASASCMVCAVKLKHNDKFIPSCASRVIDGMEIECDSPDVRETRRTALELLFSDHLGDCLSPCQRICPAHLGIPAMLERLREKQPGKAAAGIRRDLALPGILCRACHRPCESGCRRSVEDEPVAIAELVVHAIDTEREAGEPRLPPPPAERTARIAIVGAGFTGLSTAWFLRQNGYPCVVIDAADQPASTIRTEHPELPPDALAAELDLLERSGVEFRLATRIADSASLAALSSGFDAVLIATGPGTIDQAGALGLEPDGNKLAADKQTMMTSRDGIFAAGRAVRPTGKPVASVADAKAVAVCIHQYLSGKTLRRPPKPFSVFMGKLACGEIDEMMLESNPAPRATAIDIDKAIEESNRCVKCNCAKADTCKLRELALEYDVNPNRFSSGERIRYSRNVEHPLVRFEPAKCIKCGNCIKVAGEYAETLGLTFIGRGFDVHLGTPFHESMSDALRDAAVAAVDACPVGALTLRDEVAPPR